MQTAIETPVPGDEPSQVTPQLPWNSIPKFVPGTTHVQEYVQKMKFLAAMWPAEYLSQLAPRAALLVEGTAFKKVARLDPSKLRVNDQSGVATLVDAIGGSWGATELEERYEFFEKALYGTVQRSDESHDSYLSRMEASFVELLSRGTKLEEVQAYVLLRQSLLSSEDKKRILLEHSGELKYNPVVKSFRLLGSKFFSEMQGNRQSAKTKVYDVNLSEMTDGDARAHDEVSSVERAFVTMTEEADFDLDAEFMDLMIAAEDQDALVVSSFEQELEEFLQEVPDMHDAMVSYLEARSKLLEKKRSRGFWPVKFSDKGGKSSGKFKGRGKGKRQREQLLSRIARSTCRICHQKGHWKAECPNRDKFPDGGSTAAANIAEVMPAGDLHEVLSEPESVPSVAEDAQCSLFQNNVLPRSHLSNHDDVVSEAYVVQALFDPAVKNQLRDRIHRVFNASVTRKPDAPVLPRYAFQERCRLTDRSQMMSKFSRSWRDPEPLPEVCNLVSSSDKPCHAILDTGASRCVIGEKTWMKLFAQLPEDLQSRIRKTPSQVKFRFGNNQTLQSEYQVQLPMQSSKESKRRLLLTIEVLPGSTPFLFSKRAFKQLGGILDTTNDTCFLKRLDRKIKLELNPTELYLLDVRQLCASSSISCFKSFSKVDSLWSVQSGGVHCSPGPQLSQPEYQHETHVESIALSMAKPVSKTSPSTEKASLLPESQHAVSSDDGLLAYGGRSCREPADFAAAIHDSSAGGASREPRESSRDDANPRKHGAGAAESEDIAAKPYVPRPPSTEHPRFHWRFNTSRKLTKDASSKIATDRAGPQGGGCEQFASVIATSDPSHSSTARSTGIRGRHHGDQSCDKLASSGGERGRSDCRHRGQTPGTEPRDSSVTGRIGSKSPLCHDSRRLGPNPHWLGKETQREDLCSGLSRRFRILPMGKCSIQQPDTRDSGFCPVLQSAGRSGSTCLGSLHGNDQEQHETFHADVCQVREKLSQQEAFQLFNSAVHDSITKAEGILHETFVSPAWSVPKKACILLEIYAESNSPLTEAMRKLGYFAIRFTRQDGDLSTTEGRRALWNVIDKHQPLNIWVAPECGPWGGWNRLNMYKSVAMFDKVVSWQKREACHVELCSQLCEFQVKRSRHFHLEQPNGSTMPQLPVFKSIQDATERASFDMCMFGLKHPLSRKALRKSSQVFSTDPAMVKKLQASRCDHQHVHQVIEGSVNVNGHRMALTRFCASYCSGFVQKVVKWMVQHLSQESMVGEHEDEPPAKRSRFTFNPSKRFKSSHAIDLDDHQPKSNDPDLRPSSQEPEPSSSSPSVSAAPNKEPMPVRTPAKPAVLPAVLPSHENSVASPKPAEVAWRTIFQDLDKLAPRVCNLRLDASHAVFPQIQGLVPQMTLHVRFVCRGTERMQLPISLHDRHVNIVRHTVSLHRTTGEMLDFGCEEWVTLKRSLRLRNAVPSKLMITSFGTWKESSTDAAPSAMPMPGPANEAVPLKPAGAPCPDNPKAATQSVFKPSSSEICEGWAPPPIAIHGPKFRNLTDQEKADLRKLHLNLGHPDPNVLAEHLKTHKAAQHVVEAAREFVCDACVESVGRKHQRPAKLHESRDFNDLVGMDGFFWSGSKGFRVHIFHCIDEASLFHFGRRCETRNADQVIDSWSNFWTSWARDPNQVYTDPAGEFISDQWKEATMSRSIQPLITTEAWQRGRVERHGQIIKRMLTRCDLERPIENLQEFDRTLLACFQAKNSLMRHQGFSPEQVVLGKARKIPASLSSDESVVAHELALSDEPESESFRKLLEIRMMAKKAFLVTDIDQAIRRALLRRTCPVRGPFEPGQLVMYWVKRQRASRQEAGRWHGPAKVVLQESQSAVWLSHAERLFKCAPESIRPASLRKWNTVNNQAQSWIPEIPPLENIPHESVVRDENTEYEPSLAPAPVNVTPSPLITPHSSVQPESEMFPEPNPDNIPESPQSHESPPGAGEPIDLDATDDDAALCASTAFPVLHCHALTTEIPAEPLFEVTMLEPGEEAESLDDQVCVAEDGLPMINMPLVCEEQQCFLLSIDVTEQDIHKWSASTKPEEMAWIANVCKRARAEVNIKDLSLDERIMFEKAKDAELNCWIQTSALKPILRRKLNPEQILRSRWILTWKAINEEDSTKPQRKAKARLVVLGFQDPKLCEVARDSPTLTREGRNTVLQTISSRKWELASFDIKTAFLRGQSDKSNPLAMEPPSELRKKLNLSQDQVCSLVGNAYGRVDAPLLFYKELSKQLQALHFTRHPLEPCIYILESFHDNHRTLHGIIGTHVDDGICGGDSYFYDQLEALKKVLPFGTFKQRKFVFTGIHLEQLPDLSIMASQEDYVRSIPAIDVGRPRRQTPAALVNDGELNKLRGLIGSLQYAVSHTRPDIAAKLGEVQVQVSKATVETLLLANRVLREAQEHSHVKLCFRSIPINQLTHVSFGDASFASAKQLSSFQGTLICATNHELNQNKTAPISPLTWTSKKISRVVRSTLSAEAYSMSASVDRLGWMRLLWGTINVDNFDWRQPHLGFKSLPIATIVTDCKSLFDLVSRTAMPTCEEFRTTLEVLLIKERCLEHCNFRWIPTSLQVADALTKPMDPLLLRQVLASGCFQLYDENQSLERNAHRKQAIRWFRDQQSDQPKVTSKEF